MKWTLVGKAWLHIFATTGDGIPILHLEGRQFSSDRKREEGEDAFLDLNKSQARKLIKILEEFIDEA